MRVQSELDPQFRFATPNGDVALSVTFPEWDDDRRALLDVLRRFCSWKQVIAYTMTFNLAQPHALLTVGVSGEEVVGWLSGICGEPGAYTENSFSQPEWIAGSLIGEEFLSLLPDRVSSLSDVDLKELEFWFGRDGRFPAVHVASGVLGL